MTPDWPQAALSAADLARIGRVRWRALPGATVIAVAGAWNAGRGCPAMAEQLGVRRNTVTLTLAKLKQIGVDLRHASEPARPAHSPSGDRP